MSQGFLVLNAGSSSIKFSVFALPAEGGELTLVCRGLQESLGEDALRFEARDVAGRILIDTQPTLPAGQRYPAAGRRCGCCPPMRNWSSPGIPGGWCWRGRAGFPPAWRLGLRFGNRRGDDRHAISLRLGRLP